MLLVVDATYVFILSKSLVFIFHIFSSHSFLFCFQLYNVSVIALSSFNVPATGRSEFHDPPPFLVLQNGKEYVQYLDYWNFLTLPKSDVTLTTRDCNSITRVTSVAVFVKRRLLCGGCDRYVSRWAQSKPDMHFLCPYEEAKYGVCCGTGLDRALGFMFRNVSIPSVMRGRRFHLSSLTNHSDYSWGNYTF